MKKIAAFLTAFVLFIGAVSSLHALTYVKLGVDNHTFGTWTNIYKYNSRNAVAERLTNNTLLVFGSSEFNHGRKTPYHPRAIFKNTNMAPMLIGTAYSQSMTHAIALASLEPDMKNRKAVLILSPQWFSKEGVIPKDYALRYSESNYAGMLNNKHISKELKKRIAARSESLLKSKPALYSRILKYDEFYLEGNKSFLDSLYICMRKQFVNEQDSLSLLASAKFTRLYKKNTQTPQTANKINIIEWNQLAENATRDARKATCNNPFNMSDKAYKRNIRPIEKTKKNRDKNRRFDTSPEYHDLICFLDVCKETGIEPMLVMLPFNGRWYDYTGLPEEQRENYYSKIRGLAEEYNAQLADLSRNEYSTCFMEDVAHVGWKGWVSVNESIYNFYNEN
ncbi:MAG: D-alanyl-lipoteichoic acid biosynthesis protein DltD [Clostridiales bacterium]|nr:D-alanyl-lipoteichoic acid biosynthesis protein DltD [Clostridiales bacterium]